jgi:DNA-binding NtrC family response regulator
VLVTGGYSFRPPIPGIDLKNVWFMTHPDHAESLKREIKAQGLKKAVLVGAGFINIEMAEALIRQGLDVTIVEMFDQMMPGMTGLDLAKELLAIKPTAAIIMCTSFNEAGTRQEAEAAGISDFIAKPIMMRELADSIRRALEKQQKG